MKNSISTLFTPEPIQWGLRGDPYLWREMAEHFQDVCLPPSSAELSAVLEEAFFKLTGHPVSYPHHFRVDRHAHGGMSSGGIATEFWREQGFQLLLSRFEAQQAHRPGVRAICRGDIFWVEPDGSRGSIPGVPHPHVVVQEDVFNRSRIATVVVCALTSNLNRASEPGNVLLEPGEGNLSKQSVVISSQISSIDKGQLGAKIGSLCGKRVDEVIAALRFLQVSYFREGQIGHGVS